MRAELCCLLHTMVHRALRVMSWNLDGSMFYFDFENKNFHIISVLKAMRNRSVSKNLVSFSVCQLQV